MSRHLWTTKTERLPAFGGDKPHISSLGTIWSHARDTPNIPSFLHHSDMSSTLPRTSQRLLSQSAAHSSIQRVAQVRRHLSTTPAPGGEIRDAYILSAARTPTGKVLLLVFIRALLLIQISSTALLSQSLLLSSAQQLLPPP